MGDIARYYTKKEKEMNRYFEESTKEDNDDNDEYITDGVCYCPLCKSQGWGGYANSDKEEDKNERRRKT